MVDESGLTEGTDATVKSGLEDEELDNVVSECHRASQEANMVIEEEEAVRTLVTWKDARKTSRPQEWTEICPRATSSSVPNLEQLKKKTKCFSCKREGHFI